VYQFSKDNKDIQPLIFFVYRRLKNYIPQLRQLAHFPCFNKKDRDVGTVFAYGKHRGIRKVYDYNPGSLTLDCIMVQTPEKLWESIP
jgi:hypothetical protein